MVMQLATRPLEQIEKGGSEAVAVSGRHHASQTMSLIDFAHCSQFEGLCSFFRLFVRETSIVVISVIGEDNT